MNQLSEPSRTAGNSGLAEAEAPKSTLTAAETLPDPAIWLRSFTPRRWMRNGHVQTIIGNYMRRTGPLPPISEELVVPVEAPHETTLRDGRTVGVPETSILCLCHWQPSARAQTALTVVLVHGLEGSASSGYILGNTSRLWAEGCNIIRMNMRACGGSDALSPTIYHSGRSGDIGALLGALRDRGCSRIALVGYSMGGNLVLKYAGEQSLLPSSARPCELVAVAGISPLLDLAPSSAALHFPSNRLYEARFLRAMKRRIRAKAQLFPELYGLLEQEQIYDRIRSLRDFDGQIVARFGGFRDASDYYEQVRSSRYVAALRWPTLIVHALDDPFIRSEATTREALLSNPYVQYVETSHGGHCAFLADPAGADQGRWAEETLARWLTALLSRVVASETNWRQP